MLGPEQRASRGTAGPQALAALRRAWRCDCDGRSHRASGTAPAGPVATVERHLDVIERLTGHRPPTCPWRAFFDPLVAAAIKLSNASDGGYVTAKLGLDPPEVLLEALESFRVSRAAGQRHVRAFLERKRKGPGGGGPRPGAPSSGGGGFVSMRRTRLRRG